MYLTEITEDLDDILSKLSKKDPKKLDIILNKMEEILENPNHYKNLKKPLNNLKRVHIDKNHVLVFAVNENTNTVIFVYFDHHDKIYCKNYEY
uniref:Plasmid stabilization system n=1 Tax=Methanococcus maripaludis (strain C6 / ATCC BAA-1332) TaxID=444158 RepID=A9A6F6_METM6